METIRKKLNELYDEFFESKSIDKKTGMLKDSHLRFATKIAIGNEYLESKEKILFVSFDIGKDEKFVDSGVESFQDFDERRDSVCNSDFRKNPHMAGTYGTALYFLKEKYNWIKEWEILENQNQFFREALLANADKLPNNVLDKVALVNFYNFVSKGRNERTGGNDRIFIDTEVEIKLLIDTINTIKPSIIIVQSKSMKNYFVNFVKPNIDSNCKIFVGYHPSVFGRGINYRRPKNYITNLIEKGRI